MINQEVKQVMDKLNIPFFYMTAPINNHNSYCIFSIYKEQETGVYDNDVFKVDYYCTLNFWYKTPQEGLRYTEIKRALKNAKIIVRDVIDLAPHNGYYGKSFSLKITRLIEK